jgi:cbb3-type cytochrome oxidase maturation protein
MTWVVYGILFLIAMGISASAVYALAWASKSGQFTDFDAQSRSIFDETEPEGMQTDFFPGRNPHIRFAGTKPADSTRTEE